MLNDDLTIAVDEIEPNALVRIKAELKRIGFSYPVFSNLIKMPLQTFQDKINGKFPFKLSEFCKICIILGKTSDELLFGDAAFIKNYNFLQKKKNVQTIKDFLIKEQNYKTLGKLEAEGFFKILEK